LSNELEGVYQFLLCHSFADIMQVKLSLEM
jgi:hypothetical protein